MDIRGNAWEEQHRHAQPPAVPQPPEARPAPRRRLLRRLARRGLAVLVVLQVLAGAYLVGLQWWTPSRTMFMLADGGAVQYQFVSIDHISRYTLAVTIAHEDQQLGERSGAFTTGEFTARAEAYLHGEDDPTGSTIPQQLAKNIFLWPHQDPLRKGLEAVLSTELTGVLSDQRVLELYLDYAQFGPHLYGICAASWYYFDEPPWDVTIYQASQLMGVLPAPERVTRAAGGGINLSADADPLAVDLVDGAANVHVPRELAGLGGWQAAVATVGITDTAADHAADRGDDDACSTMPSDIADRIAAEDPTS